MVNKGSSRTAAKLAYDNAVPMAMSGPAPENNKIVCVCETCAYAVLQWRNWLCGKHECPVIFSQDGTFESVRNGLVHVMNDPDPDPGDTCDCTNCKC